MSEPRRLDLANLATHELAELGTRLRRCGDGGSLRAIAERIVDALWTAFGSSLPQLALVRLFVEQDPGTVSLVGTQGLEPVWCSIPRDNPPVQLANPDAIAAAKLVATLLAERDDHVFVPETIGHPLVPAQRDFVLRYGVRSAVACRGALPTGRSFALVVFSRIPLTSEVASYFSLLALHAGLALSNAEDLVVDAATRHAARAQAVEDLLHLQETVSSRRERALAEATAELGRRVPELERALADSTTQHVHRFERAQRGMLNVIEDLREARATLELRVAERTRDLERANLELRSSNAELEQFAYVASHDLQEPLRTIGGYLQLLEERYHDRLDTDAQEFITFAIRGAQRMHELIDALLDYSRVSRAPISFGPVALDQALDETLQTMDLTLRETHAAIEREPLPVIRGDRVQMRQLFQNLISNAVKFAGDTPPRIQIRAEHRERDIALTVRDFGIGFDPKYSEQVFNVFRRLQRKLPGTGIGLAICKRIVERHGGTIRAEASPGRGATFELILPAEVSSP
jgi:signal transduction histidine kinase